MQNNIPPKTLLIFRDQRFGILEKKMISHQNPSP